jgi:AmmeMemoRadiSam system protein B
MPGPSSRTARRPAVAGLFYPADERQCVSAAAHFVRANAQAAAQRPWFGAIVPHAGWICSGAIAGEAIGTLRASPGAGDVDVVVVFGAVHTPLPLDCAVLASHEAWDVPGGESVVPTELSAELEGDSSDLFGVDDRFHDREHAVEVELPLIQRAWPKAMVLPIEVPLRDDAVTIGARTAAMVQQAGLRPVYLASSDLTHYGPNYSFAPVGVGLSAMQWAKENDRKLLEVVTAMTPERVVPHVRENLNACGGGAIAAMLSACREHGASNVNVLRHANSFEVLRDVAPQRPDNAVGYAAVVVG